MPTDTDRVKRFFRALDRGIHNLPGNFIRNLQGHEGQLANRTLALLQREPGPPNYPLRWSSQRQRRAYFATGGFGGGIPTRRSGKILRGWKVEVVHSSPLGGEIILSNSEPAMTYVQGRQQQPFHRDTGWVQIDDALNTFFIEANGATVEIWRETVDGTLLEAYRTA